MPPSNKKSINIEDLIDDEATVEDFEEYNQIYPDLDAVVSVQNHCTSCFKHLGLSLAAVPKIRLHSILKVTICKECYEFYNSGEFERGEDGSELYCRWCGQGGEVYCCSKCIYVFCKECIRKNLGFNVWKRISKQTAWDCFRCDSNQLLRLRARHHVFTNYLLNRQNHVNSIAKNAVELKALLLEDMSTCCGSASKPASTSNDVAVAPKVNEAAAKQVSPAISKDLVKKVGGPKNSLISTFTAPAKRSREENGDIAKPGPLSKKLKMQQSAEPPPKNSSVPRSKPAHVAKKPNVTYIQPLNPVLNSPTASDDESDLFSLLNPIVELDIPPEPEAPPPVDPLSLDNSPHTSQFSYGQPRPAVPISPPPEMAPLQLYQLPQQQQQPQPPLLAPMEQTTSTLHFGGHFMAMDPDPYTRGPPVLRVRAGPPIRLSIPAAIRPTGLQLNSRRFVTSTPMAPMNSYVPAYATNQMPVQQTRPFAQVTGGAQSLYHYVNGFKVDLKAASEMNSITLPDGKVILVRRQINATGPAYQISTQDSSPRFNGPSPGIQPVVMNTPTTSSSMQQLPGPRFQTPSSLQVRLHTNGPQQVNLRALAPKRVGLSAATRPPPKTTSTLPRRKTTVVNRPLAPQMYNTQIPPLAINMAGTRVVKTVKIASQLYLQSIVNKLKETLAYAEQKASAFENSKLYKAQNRVQDVLELQTNLSYIISDAAGQLSEIKEKNTAAIEALRAAVGVEQNKVNEDELQLLEDKPTCIDLDSDEDTTATSPTPSLRCKTVTEINRPTSQTKEVPVKRKPPVSKAAIPTANKNHIPVTIREIIDLDDSDEEEESNGDKKIVTDILDELIDALFVPLEEELGGNKENAPPSLSAEHDLKADELEKSPQSPIEATKMISNEDADSINPTESATVDDSEALKNSQEHVKKDVVVCSEERMDISETPKSNVESVPETVCPTKEVDSDGNMSTKENSIEADLDSTKDGVEENCREKDLVQVVLDDSMDVSEPPAMNGENISVNSDQPKEDLENDAVKTNERIEEGNNTTNSSDCQLNLGEKDQNIKPAVADNGPVQTALVEKSNIEEEIFGSSNSVPAQTDDDLSSKEANEDDIAKVLDSNLDMEADDPLKGVGNDIFGDINSIIENCEDADAPSMSL